jgi:Domain of unknown function (DUF4115)
MKRTVETTATNSIEAPAVAPRAPQPTGFVSPTGPFVPHRKLADEASKPASTLKALPLPTITRVKAVPIETASAQPARVLRATVDSGANSAHSILIRASDISWVTACADGVKVFGKVFNKGDSGEVRFSSRAAVHSGNAGAIELRIGDQPIGLMGRWGQVRTMNATPAGYEYVATTPAGNCSETSPPN